MQDVFNHPKIEKILKIKNRAELLENGCIEVQVNENTVYQFTVERLKDANVKSLAKLEEHLNNLTPKEIEQLVQEGKWEGKIDFMLETTEEQKA